MRGSSCGAGWSPFRDFEQGPVALERSPWRNPVRIGLQPPDVELPTFQPPAEAFLIGFNIRPPEGNSLPPVVRHPLPVITFVLQQFGQILPERLLRAEHQGRNLRIGLFRRSLPLCHQACVHLGPDQDVRVVRQGIDNITPATKIRTNPYSRFGPATADRGSRGIRDQPRNSPKHTEKRIRINFRFPCPSRGQLPPVERFRLSSGIFLSIGGDLITG